MIQCCSSYDTKSFQMAEKVSKCGICGIKFKKSNHSPQEDAPQEFMWGRGEIMVQLSVYIPLTIQAFAGIT